MSGPRDSALRPATPPRTLAVQERTVCAWCMGAGKYLEALDCDVAHAYLPVVCQGCAGTGRRRE
jgi:DnaJ-class molecular chaperone